MIVSAVAIAIGLSTSSCNKPEATTSPAPGNEFLTTTMLIVTDTANPSFHDTAVWSKINPEDTSPPDTSRAFLTLQANHTYSVYVLILDSTQTPAANISDEIWERRNYHLLCFTAWDGLNIGVQRTDYDTNNPPLPVGLNNNFITGATSSGRLEVQLRHQPNVKTGDCAPGSTDLDVFFNITVQ
ncbi:MAG TPA: hypothetical protein VGB95_03935 [Chitinophagales bacterium]